MSASTHGLDTYFDLDLPGKYTMLGSKMIYQSLAMVKWFLVAKQNLLHNATHSGEPC
jgi:hypothetical protein